MRYKFKKSFRLFGYDSSQSGEYFVTICTKNFVEHFGKVVMGKVVLNDKGKIAQKVMISLPEHHPVILHSYIIMPNHIHVLLEIVDTCRNIARYVPTETTFSAVQPKSLGTIVRSFKSETTRLLRAKGSETFAWQSRYFDHVIRNEKSFSKIEEYIELNPLKWYHDRYYPKGEW